jgi:diaminohydroxyphosphoribosylaminopyrimidine deaminase / 5-amino-6-(5-phosphoribosylamino)uracil reductase
MNSHERFMREALRLARRGLGRTRPNPAVGAVIVKGGRIIGRGFHRKCGDPHAEIEALAHAAAPVRGADLYVTLEPCGHQGRTPPCAPAIAAAGIRRVFYACPDPHSITAGKGIAILRRAGVQVVRGPLEAEARAFNEPYLTWVRTGMPLVTAKWAMTLDGKIATSTGDARWVTAEKARRRAHRLRAEVDAILVGTDTVIRDDPELTCRLPGGRTPLRVILDRRGRIPHERRVFSTLPAGPVLVYTRRAGLGRLSSLRDRGVEVVAARSDTRGFDLRAILRDLGRRGIHHLLVEGGSRLLGSFFDRGLVDRAVVFVAPAIAGGAKAVTPVAGQGVRTMNDAVRGRVVRVERAGPDFVLWVDL